MGMQPPGSIQTRPHWCRPEGQQAAAGWDGGIARALPRACALAQVVRRLPGTDQDRVLYAGTGCGWLQ